MAMDTTVYYNLHPTHNPEHSLVTRARHAFENARQTYDNTYSNWEQGLDTTPEEVEETRVLMQAAENNLVEARRYVLNLSRDK
jgi:hypothetical protein